MDKIQSRAARRAFDTTALLPVRSDSSAPNQSVWETRHRGVDAEKKQRDNICLPTMKPIARITLFPHSCGRGEVVLRAYECLREAGINPVGYTFVGEPRITLTLKTRKKGLAALLAGGFDFKEV